MKKVLILFLLLSCGISIQAQYDNFSPGEILVTPALGLGTPYIGTGIGYSTSLPPLSVSVDYGIEQDILDEGIFSVGGYFAIAQKRFRSSFLGNDYGWNFTYVVIGPRGTVSFPVEENLDVYGGLMLGYNIATAREVGDVPSNVNYSAGGFAYDFFAGGRYFLKENLAAMAELGYGVSLLRIGVSFRL